MSYPLISVPQTNTNNRITTRKQYIMRCTSHNSMRIIFTNQSIENNASLSQFIVVLGFPHLPKNQWNYSHMKAVNIIMIVLQMVNEYTYESTTKCSRITTRWDGGAITQMEMMVMAVMIDAKAFAMIELMEMDSLLRIPPPDTFRRLGFGEFLWSGSWSLPSLET